MCSSLCVFCVMQCLVLLCVCVGGVTRACRVQLYDLWLRRMWCRRSAPPLSAWMCALRKHHPRQLKSWALSKSTISREAWRVHLWLGVYCLSREHLDNIPTKFYRLDKYCIWMKYIIWSVSVFAEEDNEILDIISIYLAYNLLPNVNMLIIKC